MERVRLAAMDIDGTLWDYENGLHERVEKALTQVCASKAVPVIATGCALDAMKPLFARWPKLRYYILANGAYIYDAAEEKTIYRDPLPRKAVQAFCNAAADTAQIELFADGAAYVQEGRWAEAAHTSGDAWEREMAPSRIRVADIRALVREREKDADRLSLHFQSAPERVRVMEICEKVQANCLFSGRFTLEVNGPGASKGRALAALCESLGIEGRAVLAMGDGQSDISMLQFAGIPVAPANAVDEVKTCASVIAPSCMDGGLAWVLHKYILDA